MVGDANLLIQDLVNLLDHANALSPAGGQIVADCRIEEDRVRFWVADTCPGILIEHHSRVFDRFYRVDSGRTCAQGGSGLGRAIWIATAEVHGRATTLTSEVGKGTRAEPVGTRGLGPNASRSVEVHPYQETSRAF
jgi:signal transduction histidine kinase